MAVKGRGFEQVHSLQDAQDILLSHILPLQTVSLASAESLSMKLSKNVNSPVDLPGFLRSAMDGYALKSSDIIGATVTNPIELKIVGKIEIGDISTPELKKGETIEISTGAPLPEGADTVVKLEDVELHEKIIEVTLSLPPGKNVAKADEDIRKGQLVLEKGTILQPWDIAILESMGYSNIDVYQSPKIVTFSTGDELVASGSKTVRGQVIDSNRPAINAWITKLGGEVAYSKCIKDNPESIKNALINAVKEFRPDLMITTGGTSVGSKDYIPEIIQELGDLWVHGIAIRPGKPVALGKIKTENGEAPIIALPGYPLAAFLNFYNFASPVITAWTGRRPLWTEKTKVTLGGKVPSKAGYVDFVRLKNTDNKAEVIRTTGAGILSSLVKADYLLIIPEDIEGYDRGDEVEVVRVRDL